jgi:hypothetical protein
MVGLTGLMLLRMSRNIIVPLWADAIGVAAILLGTITSAGGLLETALVVPAGLYYGQGRSQVGRGSLHPGLRRRIGPASPWQPGR